MKSNLMALLLVLVTAGCASMPGGLQGRIENGRYSAPNGKVSFNAPDIGSSAQKARDVYVPGVERGFLEVINEFGLQAVYYTSLAGLGVAKPTDPTERHAALLKGWSNFAMPNIFSAATANAEVVHQESVDDPEGEMLATLVRLPELSGAFDLNTGKKFDAYPGALLLIDGDYVVVLRNQYNLEDVSKKDPKEKFSTYLKGLRKRKAELAFRQ